MKYLKTYRLYLLICAFMIMFTGTKCLAREAEDNEKSANDIVVILDVSGSMKTTDADRLCFESIELLLNLCDEEDRVGVVAFNEEIVYQSPLVHGKDKDAIRQIKEKLSHVEYSGDTDNGLGLKTGISMLTAQDHTYRNQAIIFIADGRTDLPNPVNARTIEDSYADMESAQNIASAQKIAIHTIGLCTSDSDIADELTAMSAATQGTSNICAGALQMMNTVVDIALQYKPAGQSSQSSVKLANSLRTSEIEILDGQTAYIVMEASSPILDFEVVSEQKSIQIYETKHCRVVRCDNTLQEKISICYRCIQGTSAIIRTVQIDEPQPQDETESETQPKTVETEVAEEIPEASWTESADAIEEKQESNPYLIPAILVLALITAGISGCIIYIFSRKPKEKRNLPVLKGYLHACFIDLKSKNDIPDMEWNLKDYPEAGVSLRELFESSGIHEDLPQLDQICLYPDEEAEGLLLVHCTEGGVFIDDRTVSSNVPAHVQYGETIYIAFPENASEFSLRYFEKKEAE